MNHEEPKGWHLRNFRRGWTKGQETLLTQLISEVEIRVIPETKDVRQSKSWDLVIGHNECIKEILELLKSKLPK